jgi:hypothetical protein
MSTHLPTATQRSSAQPDEKQTHAPSFLLTHIGRKSGKMRRTILAVLSYDADTKEIKAVSAWNAASGTRTSRPPPPSRWKPA